jgi:hypothetical protein
MLEVAEGTFSSDNQIPVKDLFKLGSKYLGLVGAREFVPMKENDFASAIKKLSPDEQALAYAYYNAINSKDRHVVDIIKRTEYYDTQIACVVESAANYENSHYVLNGTGRDVEVAGGGGLNYLGKEVVENGSYTVIITNTKAEINDYYTNATLPAMCINPPPQVLAAHEVFGHGLGGVANSDTWLTDDAIQMENLYNRVKNPNIVPFVTPWRNGKSHGKQVDYSNANAIPAHISAGLFMLKFRQALSGTPF